jgi:hypothetical protein
VQDQNTKTKHKKSGIPQKNIKNKTEKEKKQEIVFYIFYYTFTCILRHKK